MNNNNSINKLYLIIYRLAPKIIPYKDEITANYKYKVMEGNRNSQ